MCNVETCGALLRTLRADIAQQLSTDSSAAHLLPDGQAPWTAGFHKEVAGT